jgi:alpha-beta hydrolase superfamily lysophospholipase
LASFLIVVGGLLALAFLFESTGWSWLLVTGVGFVAGAVARRASAVWLGLAGVVVFHATTLVLGLPRDTGPFWYIAAAAYALLLAVAFLVGTDVGWRKPVLGVARDGWRSLGRWSRRLLVAGIVAAVAAPIGYAGVVLAIGPDMFIHPTASTDCRTPMDVYGWDYEAINYDKADDDRLTAANPDKMKCRGQGVQAGADVVSSDGIRLAGWYIPAASSVGPAGPTLVLVHGWKANKSSILGFAAGLHDDYNLVLFDLRNNGRSSGTLTSMGLWEQRDLTGMLDWLEATKRPSWIGVVGNSMGAATALSVAVTDQRVRALVLDSMHAEVVTSTGTAMEADFGFPGGPAAWLLMTAVSMQVGGDVMSTDPIRQIDRMGDRPVLLTAGANDQVDPPGEATQRNLVKALEAGVPIEVAYCQGARHGKVVDVCPKAWASWTLSFLERARRS